MERLYNGIVLPDQWPPENEKYNCFQPMRVPYLEEVPEVIFIDCGRQLFVDDFLIEHNNMVREFHSAVKYPGNPIFFPQTKYENTAEFAPCAIPKCGGICYDDKDKLFKMWYIASYVKHFAYAFSHDGIHWERPELDVVPGTNLILQGISPDSGTVWLDHNAASEGDRFKLMIREVNGAAPDERGQMRVSADGIHWSEPRLTGKMDDRSTMFYNPFRRKWVQSIRRLIFPRNRCRSYWEDSDFYRSGEWDVSELPFWTGADCYDHGVFMPPELYNLDAAPYESIILGFFQILKGPPNFYGEQDGRPKLTELYAAYSRDGFHWARPDREVLIPACREEGSWEYGYVESTPGLLCVVGDELWIYYSAYAGDTKRAPHKGWTCGGMYSNGAVGLAKLRRDGFVSLHAGFDQANVTTRKLQFSGGRLFVNANTAGSILSAECLQEDGNVFPGFSKDECIGFHGNSTCAEISWRCTSLKTLADKPVKFRFSMERGDLYSFWVTDSEHGASGGYLAAGGPGYSKGRDCM